MIFCDKLHPLGNIREQRLCTTSVPLKTHVPSSRGEVISFCVGVDDTDQAIVCLSDVAGCKAVRPKKIM